MIDRYTRPEMARIWTLENKFRKWLEVEILACEAWAELGVIPREAVERIREKAGFSVERILEIEEVTRHDVVAFTTAVAERVGDEAKYIHYGLTSSDVVDTALSALMVEAAGLIINDLEQLADVVRQRAIEFKDTVMMGRTHGVHAEPTTFGLKLALWWQELLRDIERMRRARETVAYGKISGAVGTYANVDPFVEEYVCRRMGLSPSPISTQILQRDRHAEYLTALAITAGTLEKMALEIRGLQKTEIREVEEPFRAGQKGSSAMPHKRNPVTCEQICGLARLVRGNAHAALEDMALWHERDISHSSVERVILPDSTILIDYLTHKMIDIIRNLHVYPENMRRNMEATGGLIYSQRVLLALVSRGLAREKAYALVQGNAMRAWNEGIPFRELIAQDWEVAAVLPRPELEACFDPTHHLRHVDTIFRRLGLLE